MYYQDPKNPYKKAIDQLLQDLLDNQEFLSQNLPALSGIMKAYNEITSAGRFHPKNYLADSNPKYPFEVLESNLQFHDLIWDAWSYWVQTTSDFYRHGKFIPKDHPFESKENLTMDEMIQFHLSPAYAYSRLFKDKYCVYNLLFNCPGNGYEWINGFPVKTKQNLKTKFSSPQEIPDSFKNLKSFLQSKAFLKGKELYAQDTEEHHASYRFLLDNMKYIPRPEQEKIIEELIVITQEKSKEDGKDPQEIIKHFQSYLEIKEPVYPYAHIARIFKGGNDGPHRLPENIHSSFITGVVDWSEYVVQNCKHSETVDAAKEALSKYSNYR